MHYAYFIGRVTYRGLIIVDKGVMDKKKRWRTTVSGVYIYSLLHLLRIYYDSVPDYLGNTIIFSYLQPDRSTHSVHAVRHVVLRRFIGRIIIIVEFYLIKRYMILAPATMAAESDPKTAAAKCLQEIQLDPESYRIGHTKASFLRKIFDNSRQIFPDLHTYPRVNPPISLKYLIDFWHAARPNLHPNLNPNLPAAVRTGFQLSINVQCDMFVVKKKKN